MEKTYCVAYHLGDAFMGTVANGARLTEDEADRLAARLNHDALDASGHYRVVETSNRSRSGRRVVKAAVVAIVTIVCATVTAHAAGTHRHSVGHSHSRPGWVHAHGRR